MTDFTELSAAKKMEIRMSPQFGTLCAIITKNGWLADKRSQEALVEVSWMVYKQAMFTIDQFEVAFVRFMKEKATNKDLQSWSMQGFVDNISRWMCRKKAPQVGSSPSYSPDWDKHSSIDNPTEHELKEAQKRLESKIPALARMSAKLIS